MREHIHILIVVSLVFAASHVAFGVDFQHEVCKGDTLSEIAAKYDVPLKSLIQANGILNANHLRVGMMLRIPGKALGGIWYEVQSGDTLSGIARRHGLGWKVLQLTNDISSPRHLRVGAKLFIPNGSDTAFRCPLRIPIDVTSKYGHRYHPITGRYRLHEGIDFRAAVGTRVYAAQSGKVIYAGRKGGYGKVIGIQHAGDWTTWYGHLSRIRVSVGKKVGQGQVIGLSGNTGMSTGPHLHFEIRYKGKSENPVRYLTLR